MQKFIVFSCLWLWVPGGLPAQCLTQPACPATPQTVCDTTANDIYYWNDPAFADPITGNHDLGELPTDLSMSIVDSCGTGNVQISFVLLLDLNGDGVRETAVSSAALPGTGIVYYGNAANPNYTGGAARYFDTRPVPTAEKYEFALERTAQDSLITVRVRWANALHPNAYVLPELPGGTHRIEWRFEKDGAIKTCGYDFVVKDCQAPTLTGINGLTSKFFPPLVQVWAIDLVLSADDNHSPRTQLQYGIRRSGTGTDFPVNSPGIQFNCEDVGHTRPVEIWVKDLAGNAAFYETYVIIQDNFGACGCAFGTLINICAISYCGGGQMEEVGFDLQGSNPGIPPFSLFTLLSTGCLSQYGALPISSNYTVIPSKDNNPLNGVSTYDLVLISRHILALEALNSPYKVIAADANRSGSITSADLVELRKLILGIYQELPNNTSWRFVDSSFVFPNPDNPFQTVFPESISFNNTLNGVIGAFYSIKIGDVNCNAILNISETPEEAALTIPNLQMQTNDIVEVPVRFLQASDYYGFQFGLHFDPAQVEVLAVIPEVGTQDNFALFQDRLHVSWSDVHPAVFLPAAPAFRLRIKALAPLQLADVFRLTTEELHAEAYSDREHSAQPAPAIRCAGTSCSPIHL